VLGDRRQRIAPHPPSTVRAVEPVLARLAIDAQEDPRHRSQCRRRVRARTDHRRPRRAARPGPRRDPAAGPPARAARAPSRGSDARPRGGQPRDRAAPDPRPRGQRGPRGRRAGGRTTTLEVKGRRALQRLGLVRFNPFEDTGSNQSFAIAVLDADDDGVILSSLHARSGTRIYAKSLVRGVTDLALSEEESEAVRLAKTARPPRDEPRSDSRGDIGSGNHPDVVTDDRSTRTELPLVSSRRSAREPAPLDQLPVWHQPAAGEAVPSDIDDSGLGTLLDGLNAEQRRAVTHGDGPLLVVAGAGTARPRSSPGASPG